MLLAASVTTADVPPADSVPAVLADTARLLAHGRELAPALDWPPALLAATAPCAATTPAPTACAGLDLLPCVRGLVTAYDAVRAAPPQPSPSRALAAELLAEGIGTAIVRMQEAVRAVGRGECALRADTNDWPARVLVGPSPARLVVEPVLPLRAGAGYALVVDGLTPAELTYAQAHVVPRLDGGRLVVPSGAFVAPLMARRTELGGLDLARASALMERLEHDAAELPAWPAIAGAAFTLPAPRTGAQLAALRVRWVAGASVPAAQAVVTFDVLDVRAGLLAYRRALAALPCSTHAAETITNDPVLAGPFPHVESVLRFRFTSLDLRTGSGAPATLGADPDPSQPVTRPLLAAIPRDVAPDAPLVLLVGGLKQPASVMLAAHAEGIAARGMIGVALELPHQGALEDGGEILTLFDPAALARSLRQATIDALAVVGSARRCGFVLPDGRRLEPNEVRYAGFSLGAMVGTLVRAVEPELGATVLIAPGGDHATWSAIRVAQALGSPLAVCVGGADDGRNCFERRTCAPPGVCGPDPAMQALATALRLPYTLASAGGEPLAFANEPLSDERPGTPLLLLTGGADLVMPPHLSGRLADAYGLVPTGQGRRARGTMFLVESPTLGHELSTTDAVRTHAYTFLASRGGKPPGAP